MAASNCTLLPNSTQSGQTGIYRTSEAPAGPLLHRYDDQVRTMYDAFQQGLSRARDKDCVGYRTINAATKERGGYVWETFAQVAAQADALGAGFRHLLSEHAPESTSKVAGSSTTPIGVWSINRKEYTLTGIAAAQSGLFTVGMYDTLGEATVKFVINHAELPLIVCAGEHISHLLQIQPDCPTLKVIVSMDPLTRDNYGVGLQAWAQEKGVILLDFNAVIHLGTTRPLPHIKPKPEDLALLLYTSGTTGNPKGAMISHYNMVSAFTSINHAYNYQSGDETVISYLPNQHVFGLVMEWGMLQFGGRIGYYSGQVEMLVEDIQWLQPTVFPSVPRLLNRIYAKIRAATVDAPGNVGRLAQYALDAKIARLRAGQGVTHPVWDRLIFNKVRNVLGGNVRVIVTGSAPIASEILDFFRVAFCTSIIEAYGSTENTGCATHTHINETRAGHVGSPCLITELKLVDVPEMNYRATDPEPRGEICTRGPGTFMGYYKDEEKTKEALIDGWYHTGDVGVLKDNRLYVIDRKKAIFKLSQGEYIAPEKVENVLTRDPIVLQAFVYGDSMRHALVAIVVPDPETLAAFAASHGIKDVNDLSALCRDARLTKLVLARLSKHARNAKLHGFEIPHAIHLEPTQFTVEAGILTPTMKLKRNDAKIAYQDYIDALYASLPAPETAKL
ncbi:hypothetical protein BC940DRAFT_295686 [Gongronella butleri]|nr:hypothetical protein BC940DRAFT_295686 [Gongronella butleri]